MKISKFLGSISLLSWLLSPLAFANKHDFSWFEETQWQAFVAQSAIYTSDYDYLSRSDDNISLDMWEAGLLFSTAVYEDLSFSAQILGRKVSEYSDEDIRIDYGFFSYPVYQTPESLLGVRFGRIRSSYGFYNETRDMPHTRTGIIMPQAVYFDMTRNSFYSSDGIELFGYQDFGERRLSLQFFLSKPFADDDESQNAASLNPRNLEGDKSVLAKVSYGSEFDGWRAAFTYYRPEYDIGVRFPISEVPLIIVDEDNASFYSENMVTSIEYNQLNWTFTLEYLRHKFHTDIPALGVAAENDFYEEAFYLQGIFRFSEQLESYVRIEQTKTRDVSSPFACFDDINLGVAYQPDEHWLVRAEAHYIEGASRLFSRDNVVQDWQDPYWTALLFQVAYRF